MVRIRSGRFRWCGVPVICHCLLPDRTWHKVNNSEVDYSGGLGGKVGHELTLELCWTMMQLAHPKVAQPKLGALLSKVCLCWTVPEPGGLHEGDLGSIPGRVIPKTQKWYLMPPYLTFSIIRYGSMVKWSNPGKGVSPSSTPLLKWEPSGYLRLRTPILL